MARHSASKIIGGDSGGCAALITGFLITGLIIIVLGIAYYSIGR